MSGECGKCHEHCLDCKCDYGWVFNANPIKQVRFCVECGKSHDTGIEDKTAGTFERIDTCIDCLMVKCHFNFEHRQVTLDDVVHKTTEELQRELGETLIEILKKTYWNPANESR